eukprot:scaffold5310_cov378-Prasinococcus_capsulatus_cf.AAC.1
MIANLQQISARPARHAAGGAARAKRWREGVDLNADPPRGYLSLRITPRESVRVFAVLPDLAPAPGAAAWPRARTSLPYIEAKEPRRRRPA